MEDIIKTDNGWYDIYDTKPKNEEEVIVILERDGSYSCTYDFNILESTYRFGYPTNYFLKENDAWKVRYWRRKELYPYPNRIVQKEIEDCKKHNSSPYQIIEYQKMCGVDVDGY